LTDTLARIFPKKRKKKKKRKRKGREGRGKQDDVRHRLALPIDVRLLSSPKEGEEEKGTINELGLARLSAQHRIVILKKKKNEGKGGKKAEKPGAGRLTIRCELQSVRARSQAKKRRGKERERGEGQKPGLDGQSTYVCVMLLSRRKKKKKKERKKKGRGGEEKPCVGTARTRVSVSDLSCESDARI